jgi:hypothetical protein
MTSNPSQVIVSTQRYACASIHALAVHHRDFPEVRGEGGSPEDAASRLAELLSITLDNAPSDWRRENIEKAIADVRAYAQRSHPAGSASFARKA